MARKANGLAHTKWLCKYHIVFSPKHRRKATCNQYRKGLGEILRRLRQWEGVEMLEGRLMPDHVHMLVPIPPKVSVSSLMGYLKGRSSPLMLDRHADLKYEFGSRKLWAEGCCVSTVGLNEATIARYIRGQERADITQDRLSVKEYEDPFARGPRAGR
ncbi:MAG: IS200/IS605 family transposase [Olsenella profusa]